MIFCVYSIVVLLAFVSIYSKQQYCILCFWMLLVHILCSMDLVCSCSIYIYIIIWNPPNSSLRATELLSRTEIFSAAQPTELLAPSREAFGAPQRIPGETPLICKLRTEQVHRY